MKNLKIAGALVAGLLVVGGLSACATLDTDHRQEQLQENQTKFDDRDAPDVTGDAEYNNYIKAQEEVYDDPATIIWCTASFPSSNSPIFTVPIAGKLTSSSVSFFPNVGLNAYRYPEVYGDDKSNNDVDYAYGENQSVDGMYHGSPPAYRYGFTPGGQYVDFSNLAVFCTTQLTEFQQQTLGVALVSGADSVTDQAEELLKNGDTEGAQELLDGLAD